MKAENDGTSHWMNGWRNEGFDRVILVINEVRVMGVRSWNELIVKDQMNK